MRTQELKALINSHELLLARFKTLVDKLPDRQRRSVLNPEVIVKAVNDEFKVQVSTPRRHRRLIYARHAASYLLRTYTDLIWAEISYYIGVTDHSSAMHSNRVCLDLMETDDDYKTRVNSIKEKLGILEELA